MDSLQAWGMSPQNCQPRQCLDIHIVRVGQGIDKENKHVQFSFTDHRTFLVAGRHREGHFEQFYRQVRAGRLQAQHPGIPVA